MDSQEPRHGNSLRSPRMWRMSVSRPPAGWLARLAVWIFEPSKRPGELSSWRAPSRRHATRRGWCTTLRCWQSRAARRGRAPSPRWPLKSAASRRFGPCADRTPDTGPDRESARGNDQARPSAGLRARPTGKWPNSLGGQRCHAECAQRAARGSGGRTRSEPDASTRSAGTRSTGPECPPGISFLVR